MTIALSAHPALNPLVGQLADALPIKGLYYPARRNPDSDLPFFSDLPAMLQATSPRVCAFLSPYADLHNDVHTCLQANVAVLCAGPVPKADQPIATGGSPSRVAPVCQGTPAAAQSFVCRAGLFAPRGRRPRAGIAAGVVGHLSPASLCQRPAGRNPIPSTSLRQPPRSRLPSSVDRHGSQRRVDPASRRPSVGARRTDPARPRRRNLGQCRAQWNCPSQHQGNPRRTRRGNTPSRTSVVARFFGKRECDERTLKRQRPSPAQRPAAGAEDAPTGFGRLLVSGS